MALYLHLDQGEINQNTPSNGRVCSLPAKRSGRYGSNAVRYYSAKSSLVLAFHTSKNAPTVVTANHPSSEINTLVGNHFVDSSSSITSNSTNAPYGFKGTYRFIRKSKTSFRNCPFVASIRFFYIRRSS